MKKYYLMAINLGHSNAMDNLGVYYYIIEKNYDLAKIYYCMAIDLNNSLAMCNLALYYQKVEFNYELMETYYLRAAELQDENSINNLAKYYFETKNTVKLFNFCIKHSIDNDAYMKLALGTHTDTETEFAS